jgi:outer membrane lipoprotein-sorting protein
MVFMQKYRSLILLPVILMAMLAVPVTPLKAAPGPKALAPDEIVKRIAAANPGLKDYTSDIAAKLNVSYAFLSTTLNLKGAYYFKAPDKSRIEITNTPSFLSQYPHVFDFHVRDWKNYNITLRETKDQDKAFYVLELVPKKTMGDLQKRVVWVSKEDFSVPVEELSYAKEGSARVLSTFKKIKGFLLLDSSKATLNFPAIKLKGYMEMTHQNHKINQGLSDEIFQKK